MWKTGKVQTRSMRDRGGQGLEHWVWKPTRFNRGSASSQLRVRRLTACVLCTCFCTCFCTCKMGITAAATCECHEHYRRRERLLEQGLVNNKCRRRAGHFYLATEPINTPRHRMSALPQGQGLSASVAAPPGTLQALSREVEDGGQRGRAGGLPAERWPGWAGGCWGRANRAPALWL